MSFTVSYLAGNKMFICDLLSRNPDPEEIATREIKTVCFYDMTSAEAQLTITNMGTHNGATQDRQQVVIKEAPPPADTLLTRARATEQEIILPEVNRINPRVQTEPTLREKFHNIFEWGDKPPNEEPRTLVRTVIAEETHESNPRVEIEQARMLDCIEGDEITENVEFNQELEPELHPLLKKPGKLGVTYHLTKQKDLDPLLKIIQQRSLENYNLNVETKELINRQMEDGHYKDIYKYIKYGKVPATKQEAARVSHLSEEYIVYRDVLYRFFIDKTTK